MLLTADTIVTMDPERRRLGPGWILVEDGVIRDLGEGPPPAHDGEHFHGALAVPGLISAHQHLVDGLLRGVDPGQDFLDWLLGVYYAGLSHVRPDECGLITEATVAQLLRAGVTTVVDCWGIDHGDPDRDRVMECALATVEAHERSGARVLFAHMFAEQVPDAWRSHRSGFDVDRLCAPAEETFERLARLDEWLAAHGSGRVELTPMPELPELVSAASFRRAHELAAARGVVLPVHLCASPASRAACGPDDLARLGVLGPGLLGVHCIAIDEADSAALAAAGVGIAHCPTANQRFPGGTTPVGLLRDAGAAIGLGLDNATLNPRIDLLGEARAAILAARTSGARLDDEDAFAMATCEAAAAIGMADRIGSLQVGHRGDVVLMDTSGTHWLPHADVVAALVWQGRPEDVRTVVVDGRVVVTGGECLTVQPDPVALARAGARLRDAMGRRDEP